ncbi:MAG: hypothetical protein WBG46_08340 [Nonlabens sp.]
MKYLYPRISVPTFLILTTALLYSTTVLSQTVQYSFDGKSRSYKSLFKAELTKSKEEINIYLLESKMPDLDKIQDNELIDHPEAMNISLVGILNQFPISRKNSTVLSTTSFERTTSEYEQNLELAGQTSKALETSKLKLEEEIKKRESKIQKLTKRVQEGDMTAVEELEKVAEEMNAIINGELQKIPDSDVELTTTFFDILINMPSEDASRWQKVIPVSGALTIKQLDNKRFVASFDGMAVYESGDMEEAHSLSVIWDIPFTSVE